jgi:hypothetical protein
MKNNEVKITKEVKFDKFIEENLKMFEQGHFKMNLLPTILYELKFKYKRKWLVQCDSENLYPDCEANEISDNKDNWVYTDNIEETVSAVSETGQCIILLDDCYNYFLWVDCNGTGIDALADWRGKDMEFLNELSERPEFEED